MNSTVLSHPPQTIQRFNRRRFLVRSAVAAAASFGPFRVLAATDPPSSACPPLGVCQPPDDAARIAAAGYTYLEAGVRSLLLPDQPAEKFEAALKVIREASIPVPACNSFFPGTMKLVGPEPRTAAALEFARTAFDRAAKAGVVIIVLGSGEARKIPEGFDPGTARQQFVDFCRALAPLAEDRGVTVTLEPLNRGETNFLNTVAEGTSIVDEIDRPAIRLMADLYHMLREDESPEALVKAGARVRHCHIAEKEQRTPPGVAGDDFRPYFAALKRIHYPGRISAECRWPKSGDLPALLESARATITRHWQDA